MKTLAKIFLLLSWVMLLMACTSEVETTGEVPEKPENPQAKDPDRRSVVISLQNKLILVKGTPETRALTREGIAEEDENHIESFDIYAFASDKEEGPYTFQERFAYRSDAGTLPAGASPLDLKADDASGKVNVVFYPRKGLFTKFYCVTNQSDMYDAAGLVYSSYTPLQQTAQPNAGTPGDAVTAPGTPTESDFLNLSSPLLQPTGFNTDILLAPLPMSGSNAQPTDLREYSMGTYVRLNISLTRAVARFDVVNDASKSHFTITDIAMGNGRQGVTLFPIRPIGDMPAAPGQLITYPDRAFNGLNANQGTTTKAFYCYPCKAMDDGFLILKGLYAVNLTDEKKEVSYRIPFERVIDGNGSRIEINHNHRYTVQITEADPFELTANIRLVDWETGNDVDDYVPDNGLDAIAVSDLLPAGETTYDASTSIITLPLKVGSSFTAATGSNAGVEAKLTYAGGSEANGWLKLDEIPVTTTRANGTQQVKYKVSFNENYEGDSYPRATLRLTDKAGGSEEVILIETTFGIPEVGEIGGTMHPDGLNSWEAADNTLYMMQVASNNSSTGIITVTSIGGSKIELPANAGITVSPTSSLQTTQEYTFQWDGTNATDLTEKEIIVTLKNNSDETKEGSIKVKLQPNHIKNIRLSSAGSGISLSSVTPTTAKLTMPIIKDRQFTITMENYKQPTVSQCPTWLENITPTTTRSTPESKTVTFTFKLIENAANFNDTQLVFANANAGPNLTLNIIREFQAPKITAAGTMAPSVNYLDGNTLHMYRVQNGQQSKAQIKVYSLGGSTLTTPGAWCSQRVVSTPNNYEKVYELYWSGNTDQLNSTANSSFYLKNSANINIALTATLVQEKAMLSFTGDAGTRFNQASGTTGYSYLDVLDDAALYGKDIFHFKVYSPAGVDINGTSTFRGGITITKSTSWSSSSPYDTFKFYISSTAIHYGGQGGSTPIGDIVLRSKQSTYFPDYTLKLINYLPIIKGYFAQYKDNKTGKFWHNAGATTNTFESMTDSWAKSTYTGWRLPSLSEWKAFLGGAWSEDENWYPLPAASSLSNIFTSIIPNHRVKCTTNDTNQRFEFSRGDNIWGRDFGSYGTEHERNIILISP